MTLIPKSEQYVASGDALNKVGKNFAKPAPMRSQKNFIARLKLLALIRKSMV